MRIKSALFLVTCAVAISGVAPAIAHNAMWHGVYGDRDATIRFFDRSSIFYQSFAGEVLIAFRDGNTKLEEGILAEMHGKASPKLFRGALKDYERMAEAMQVMSKHLDELIAIDAKSEHVELYEKSLAALFREAPPLERLSNSGVRYARVAGMSKQKRATINGTTAMLAAQKQDLRVLQAKAAQALDAFRAAIPLAEEKRFVPVMLSGRNAFGDIMPEFTDMISAYERMYTRTCMATIAATMQVYPTGFEWLEDPAQGKR